METILNEINLLVKEKAEAINKDLSNRNEALEYVFSQIKSEIEDARMLYESCKKDGLDFGSVEAEGAFRFAGIVKSIPAQLEESGDE